MSRRSDRFRHWLEGKREKPPKPKIEVPPFWKLTISLADEPENILVLPKLDHSESRLDEMLVRLT